jgi:hypothetical protein
MNNLDWKAKLKRKINFTKDLKKKPLRKWGPDLKKIQQINFFIEW